MDYRRLCVDPIRCRFATSRAVELGCQAKPPKSDHCQHTPAATRPGTDHELRTATFNKPQKNPTRNSRETLLCGRVDSKMSFGASRWSPPGRRAPSDVTGPGFGWGLLFVIKELRLDFVGCVGAVNAGKLVSHLAQSRPRQRQRRSRWPRLSGEP
jgi:hypothetical protein